MIWLLLAAAVVVVLAVRTADPAETRRLNAEINRRYWWTLFITVPGLYFLFVLPTIEYFSRAR